MDVSVKLSYGLFILSPKQAEALLEICVTIVREQGPVLYLELKNKKYGLQTKIKKLCGQKDYPMVKKNLLISDDWKMGRADWNDWQRAFENVILGNEKKPKTKLIAINTLDLYCHNIVTPAKLKKLDNFGLKHLIPILATREKKEKSYET